MAAGCQEKPEGGDGSVSLHSDAEIALPAAKMDTVISFTATADWTATVEGGDWLSVSPASGEAGKISVTLSAAANGEADARTAIVRISCGTDEATVTVTQEGAAGEEPEEPEEPEQPTGKMPRSISMVTPSDMMRKEESYPCCSRLITKTSAGQRMTINLSTGRILLTSTLNLEAMNSPVYLSWNGRWTLKEKSLMNL